jgi:hypothetical protein
MNTAEEVAVIQALGPVVAGLITSLRSIGAQDKADMIANTFAADDNWRRVMADDPNAPPAA